MIYVHITEWNYMPSKMSWHCQVSFQGSGGNPDPSNTKSCIREFPKTGFIKYKGADAKEFGNEDRLGNVCPF